MYWTMVDFCKPRGLLLSILGLVLLLNHCHAAGHGHHEQHKHLHRGSAPAVGIHASSNNTISNSSLTNPEMMVKNALESLARMNKGRLENPQQNRYQFQNISTIEDTKAKAPPLDYSNKNNTNASETNGRARRALNLKDPADSSKAYSYSIPPELVEAARVVAESTPPSHSTGNHSLAAALIQEKYKLKVNDTNMPQQSHRHTNGLTGTVNADVEMQLVISSNETATSQLAKRATQQYWMTTMAQKGASPFAPSGYKVCS
jgi:hypothetical protein